MEPYIMIFPYPLLQFILNAPAPDNEGTPTSPEYSDGPDTFIRPRQGRKMYADAPVRIFKHQLVTTVVENVRQEKHTRIAWRGHQRNIRARLSELGEEGSTIFPTEVPVKYRVILTALFEHGGQPKNASAPWRPQSTHSYSSTRAPPIIPCEAELRSEGQRTYKTDS